MYSSELQQHVIFKQWPNARAYAFYNVQNHENLQPPIINTKYFIWSQSDQTFDTFRIFSLET